MMNFKILLSTSLLLICLLFYCCKSNTNKKLSDSLKIDTASKSLSNSRSSSIKKENVTQLVTDSDFEFEKRFYLKIDKIYSGEVYTNHENKNAFYRILEIPEEEDITLFAENISIGEEGGKYQLIKRNSLTDDNSVLSKLGLYSVDSLKFIDSVTIECYFNKEKVRIDLNTLKRK